MRTLGHELGTIYVPDEHDSLDGLYRLRQREDYWAADTESTGLNQYARDFRVRLVQVGTADEAWVLRPEWHAEAIAAMTRDAWWHNWVFDALSLETSLGIPFEDTAEGAQCTDICSRLIDPRDPRKGGVGHKVENLAPHYLKTPSKKDARAALIAEARRLKLGITAKDVFANIPIDNEVYLLYAGQDVFLGARLAEVLRRLVTVRGLDRFYSFELPLSARLAQMQRIGTAFDGQWADTAEGEYDEALAEAEKHLAERWRIKQTATYVHTSRKSLQAAFETRGVKWTKFSEKTGDPSIDAEVLAELVSGGGELGELARDLLIARRNKHYGDYIRTMKQELGTDGRIHANVRPMQAATHRMSVTGVPIQQFPRNDSRPRGCLVADDGQAILSCDYAQVEFRVAAAVSGDPVMKRDIIEGLDLHAATATALFGKDFTKDQRQTAKPVGFGRLYLGSPRGIRQMMLEADPETCPPLSAVKRAVAAFDNRYRGVVRWANALRQYVEAGNPVIVTATGRPLIVDKSWAAPNYAVQSAARDIFAHGINHLWRDGLGPYLRLVVHDEVVLSIPREHAEDIAEQVSSAMSTVFKGVPIETEHKILGERWAK